jgi:hypothetical protein
VRKHGERTSGGHHPGGRLPSVPDGQQDEDGEPVKADPALGEFKAEDAKRAKTLLLE